MVLLLESVGPHVHTVVCGSRSDDRLVDGSIVGRSVEYWPGLRDWSVVSCQTINSYILYKKYWRSFKTISIVC